jgi:hypothetical protein
MRYVAVAFGVLVALAILWFSTHKPLSISEEIGKLTPGDRQALDAILADSGLTTMQLSPARSVNFLEFDQQSLVVKQGRIVGLRLSQVPLRHLEPLLQLTSLNWLWLNGNKVATLPDLSALADLDTLDLSHNEIRDLSPLAKLGALRTLRLTDNGLESVTGLQGLSKLESLDISNNRIADLKPLTSLPELTEVQAEKNPLQTLPTPTPTRWTLKTDANVSSTTERPPNWEPKRPATKDWAVPKHWKSGRELSHDFWSSRLDSLQGAAEVPGMPQGNPVTLEFSVEKGRVRAYLDYCTSGGKCDGYVVTVAEPGKPASVKGYLVGIKPNSNDNTEAGFILEAIDGEASGISFRVVR